MSNRQYRRNQVSRTLKDYLVPIIWWVLIIIIIYSFFSWGSDTSLPVDPETNTGYQLQFSSIDTEAFIEYTWGNNEQVENGSDIFKWEKLIVKEWNVTFSMADATQVNVDKIGEVKINEDGTLSFFSSNMWIDNNNSLEIQMRYANVNASPDSTISLAQNEVGSTIYVISGTAEVKNLAWNSTLVGKWQKISILSSETSKEDIDISATKSDFDNFFLGSDWFLQNNGPAILAISQSTGTGVTSTGGLTNTGTVTSSTSKLLRIMNFKDEDSVTTESINIDGTYQNPNISRIVANGIVATIDTEEKTFRVNDVPTNERENDIIIKIYDDDNSILWKELYTVYWNASTATTPTGGNQPLFKVENYSLDATEFQFISPKPNPYTTAEGVVMIEWRVPAGIVQKITVNGYTLQKFPQYGTYWTYFANEEFGNLKSGLNIYEVKYIGQDGSTLHSNAYTIVKNNPSVVEPQQTGTGTTTE